MKKFSWVEEDESLRALVWAVVEAEYRYGIEAETLLAIAAVESRFDPMAVSEKGAAGLFQILPNTGGELWADLQSELMSEGNQAEAHGIQPLFCVRYSTLMGAMYLAKLQRQFGGDISHALASYNVGPQRLTEALKDGRTMGSAYVSKVLGLATEIRAESI